MTLDVPASMWALRVQALSPDLSGVVLERLPVPAPGRGEVLVRVRAAAIGFQDLLMARGEYQKKPALPFTPGSDMAGEIVACGAEVADLQVGDAVMAQGYTGSFAEHALYPASALRAKPPTLDFATAAALGVAYLTAYVGLVRLARVAAGEWLLVHGAAGGVGLAAVDLGRALGAQVIAASASDAKLAAIAALHGPAATINVGSGFREQVTALTGGGADVIYDPVGGDVFDESTRCIAFGGRLLVVGFTSGRIPTLAANRALIKGFSVIGVRAGEYGRRYPEQGRENRLAIADLAEQRRIRPHVHAALPLAAWRDAFALIERRHVVGRVVLTPHA
jgi:NADPH2:quinone reductase